MEAFNKVSMKCETDARQPKVAIHKVREQLMLKLQ